jgi:predicted Zn-dependent peptidase
MKLYCHPTSASVHVSGVGLGAGSIYDPDGAVGMAHLAEHVVCRTSRRHPEGRKVDLLFQKYMGGPDDDINIRTDRTNVFYGHGDLLRQKYMEEIFDVMASFVHPATRLIDEEGLAVEKAAVLQEYYLRGIDFMEVLSDDLMHKVMYEKNPIRRRIDCEPDDLKHITLNDLRKFLRRYYVPRNAFAVILGPTVESAKATAERYFRDWEGRSVPTLDYDHSDDFPTLTSVRSCEVVRRGIHQYHCAIGFPTKTLLTLDPLHAEALDVIRTILERRLNWALREANHHPRKGAYRTPVYTERSFAHGMLWATFATNNREFEAQAEEIILKEYELLRVELVPHDELQSASESIHNAYLDAFWNVPLNLCEMIIHAATNGDADLEKLHARRENIQRVTRKLVREVAREYFTQNYARVLIRPA